MGGINLAREKRNKSNLTAYLFLSICLMLFLLSSCVFVNLIQGDFEISIYVAEYNSGPAVDGASVQLIKDGAVVSTKFTESGNVRFTVKGNSGSFIIKITKNGHATTTIKIVNVHSDLSISTTLRKAKFLPSGELENDINISFDIYTSESKITKVLPDENGIFSFFAKSSIYILARSTVSNIPISHMYAKIGNVPGSEYLTSPRLYSESNILEGNLYLTTFSGKNYLFIDAYDSNDNRYEVVVPVIINNITDLKIVPYLVETPDTSVYAYHLNASVNYYSAENEAYTLSTKRKNGTNLYVKLLWKRWNESTQKTKTNEPDGYVIYKSYNGKDYYKLAFVDYTKNYYYDTYNNRPNERVWYAISSKYASFEGPKTILGSVVPLPMVYITDVSPMDGATNVSLTPTFSWKIDGIDQYEDKVKYAYDIWIYDFTVNSKRYYYPLIYSPYFISESPNVSIPMSAYDWHDLPDKRLQAGKPYEWGPELIAAMWEDKANKSLSLSINCDYNFRLSPVVIEPEKYYLLVTGNE